MILFFLESLGSITDTCALFYLSDVENWEQYLNIGKAAMSLFISFNFIRFFISDVTPNRKRVAVGMLFVIAVHALRQVI